MIFEYTNYRSYLRAVLNKQIDANPSYSLRAFSKKLGVAASTLSEVINGKKNLSREKALEISQKLAFSKDEKDYFINLIEYSKAKSNILKEEISEKLSQLVPSNEVHFLEVDLFKSISNWYYPAILKQIELLGTNFNIKIASTKLGLSHHKIIEALERLERVGLIKKKNEKYSLSNRKEICFKSTSPNKALQNFHKQMFLKAQDSLESQTNKEKFVGSETLCFDEEQLSEFNELAEDFFQKIIKLSSKQKKKTNVYHLGVQFFKLDNEKGR